MSSSFYLLFLVSIKETSDNELLWHMNTLRHVVKYGGASLLTYKKQLLNILHATLHYDKSKEVRKDGARLLRVVRILPMLIFRS